MTDLHIPDAATHHLAEVIARGFPPDAPEYRAAVQRIAVPVVAAELRKFAERYERYAQDSGGSMHYTYGGVASQLADRADDLDGEGLRRFVRGLAETLDLDAGVDDAFRRAGLNEETA